MSTKILLLNVHSDRNAGDLALSRVTIQQLQANFPECEITLSMNDPDSYKGDLQALGSFFTWVMEGGRWHFNRLLWLLPATLIPILSKKISGSCWLWFSPEKIRSWMKACIEADLAVSTAGGFFRTSGRGLTLLMTTYSLVLPILAGKPLYFFPQSIGPFRNRWEKILAKWLFSRSRIVMAREPISYEQLKVLGLPEEKCLLIPDVAFGFLGASSEEAKDWLASHGIDKNTDSPLLGMTVFDWAGANPNFNNQEGYEEAIISALHLFIDQYLGKIIFLPQTWGPSPAEDDRITARRIAKKMIDRDPVYQNSIMVIDEPLTPELLQSVFGEMDLVIGTRMHSNVFSMSRCVPVIPIGYLHKSKGIASMVGLGDWVIDIDFVDSEILTNKLTAIWREKEIIRNKLKNEMPKIIEASQMAGKIVASDFLVFNNETWNG